jgi:hypothetical protein
MIRSRNLVQGVVLVTSFAVALPPPEAFAQPAASAVIPQATVTQSTATEFSVAQIDAMLAPIALYPDDLLMQMLMASTFPVQIVAAARWLEKADNKTLKGDALMKAVEPENWDPSVKSLIPFQQVVRMMNDHLEWTQQVGYAVTVQQAAVLDSIQRLRRQAQKAGNLKSTEQQTVVVKEETVVIQPAQTDVVYVPQYQPSEVYGTWPYPSDPPVYYPPPAEYYPSGYAVGAGLAFAGGVALTAGLWGWANAGWGNGAINVNGSRYSSISGGRASFQGGAWGAAGGIGRAGGGARAGGVGGVGGIGRAGGVSGVGGIGRPGGVGGPGGIGGPGGVGGIGGPGGIGGGPVGAPGRASTLPSNAIGRGNVRVPGSAVSRPGGAGLGQGRAGVGNQRPNVVRGGGPGGNVNRGRLNAGASPGGAFGGVGNGTRANQFGARGAQSRGFQQRGGGFQNRGGGAGFQGRGGGGGGFQARGGGGRGGGGFQSRGGGGGGGGRGGGGGGRRR